MTGTFETPPRYDLPTRKRAQRTTLKVRTSMNPPLQLGWHHAFNAVAAGITAVDAPEVAR